MDKIGILTLYDPINYGACLQTYALRFFLEQNGYEAQVIDYRPENGGVDKRSFLQKMRSIIWRNTFYKVLQDRRRLERTKRFKEKYIKYSERVLRNHRELAKQDTYDKLVVGSDQVWNPSLIGMDEAWFLKFGTASTRVAYAASFGVAEISDEYCLEYSRHMKALDSISVREETGAKIVKRLIDREVPVVVDPVFLVEKEQWEKLSVSSSRKKYVLCYYMQGDPAMEAEIYKMAKMVAEKKKIGILNIGKRELAKIKIWEHNAFGAGPAEFLGLIQNAEAVITNSFHGTAFSLIFEKPFVSIVNTGGSSLASRIVDLLSRLNMQEWVKDVQFGGVRMPMTMPLESKQLLRQEIAKGQAFLLNALEGKK